MIKFSGILGLGAGVVRTALLIAVPIVGAAIVYVSTPQAVQIKMSAQGLSDGNRAVALRAVSSADASKVLYTGRQDVVVRDGQLIGSFVPPASLRSESYILEACTTKTGEFAESCFDLSKRPAKQTQEDLVYSCPYYVSEQKSSKLANLTNQNSVELDNRVLCGEAVATRGDFTAKSSYVDAVAAMQPQGISGGDGVLVMKGGVLTVVSASSLFPASQQAPQTETAVPTQTIIQQIMAPASAPTATTAQSPQTLTLVGQTLSISGGNSVTLTQDPVTYAGTTSDGVLSSADWNTFAAKENSLTIGDGLLRVGDTVGLMSCAAGQILKNDGTTWVCAADAGGAAGAYTAGTGIAIDAANVISNTGVLGLSATGALSVAGGQNAAITLATSADLVQLGGQLALSATGVGAGTYNNVTVDTKGRVTSATNVAYLTTEGDSVVGNEVAGVVTGGGLVMSGSGTALSPYKVGLITTCAPGQVMKWNGSAWVCANDSDTDTDAQTLSYNATTNVLSLANGGSINLSALKDNTDSQSISRTGNTISITGSANTVDLTPYLDNTDSQTLTITNSSAGNHTVTISGGNSQSFAESQALSYDSASRTINLTNGGSVVLPADQNTTYAAGNGLTLNSTTFAINAPACNTVSQKLIWNGSAFVCATDQDTNTDLQTLSWDAGTRTLAISGSNSSVVIPDNTSGGTVTGITAGTGLTGGTITSSGTIALAASGVAAGTYGSATTVPVLTVDQYGRITSASSAALPVASATTSGILSSSDYSTFNAKENVLTFSDGLARSANTIRLMDCAASQILQRNAGDTAWVCANQVADTNTTYTAGTGLSLVGTQFANTGVLGVTASGALGSSGGQNPAITLATGSDLSQLGGQLGLTNTGVAAGTYNNVTVDAKGRVTSGTNVAYLTTEADGIVGNEVAGVIASGGLVMTGAGTGANPYKVGLITTCSDGQLLKYTTAGGWACANDNDTNTDAQTLSYNSSTNILTIAGGNTVDLSSLKDNTDSQTLSIAGNVISLTGGGSVILPADQNTTYSNGNGLSLTGSVFAINAPTCTGATAKLLWSGTAFTCGTDVDTDTNTTYVAGSGITLSGTTFSLAQQGATSGQVLAWNGSSWAPVTPSSFSDTDQQSLSYNSTTGVLSIDRGTGVTFPLSGSAQTKPSLLTAADYVTFNAKENILTFSDGLTRSTNTVTLMDCAANQILQRNTGDTAWVCANQVVDTDTNTTYTAGTGLSLTGTTFANTGILSVTASGALASSGGQNPAITLSTTSDLQQLSNQLGLTNTGVTAGTYNNVTVDAKGRVTTAGNVSYLTSETDAVIGNEVAGVVNNGGLVMTGSGTAVSPYKVGLITTCTDGQLLKYTAAGGWACANDIDTDTNTDQQTLSWNTGTNILTISGGNTVDLGSLKDNTDSQTLSIAGNVISLTNGGSVTLPADQNTTYTAAANGGLALNGTAFSLQSCTSGQIFKASATAGQWACASDNDTTYTAGTGITITSGVIAAALGTDITSSEIVDGTIAAADLANSGATAGTYGNTGVSVAQLTVNAQGQVTAVSNRALPTANTTTTGVLSSTDWNTFNGKENVLTFDGKGLFSRTGNAITAATCATNEIMKWNGTAWACAVDATGGVTDGDKGDITVSGSGVTWTIDADSVALGTDTTGNYTAGATAGNGIAVTGTAGEGWSPTIAINAPTCTAGQYLTWSGSAFSCGTPTDTNTTGVAAGTYGSTTTVPQLVVDAAGKITSITNQAIAFPAEVDGVVGNEVTNATANGGLVRAGSGTSGSPYTLGLLTTCTDQQLLKWTAGSSSWGCAVDNTSAGTSVTSLNSLNGALTLAAGTTGTDFNVSTAGSTITYNLPSASTTARGAVTTGAQTFGGAKTFNTGSATVAFQVTDGALPHFTIDTANKQVQIGSGTSDGNAIALVLDSYNVATDPTGTNGAMYYNSNVGKFRCYEAGAWKDCIASAATRMFVTTTQTNSTTTQGDVAGLTASVQAGRTYIFSCKMSHTTAATTTAGLFSINGPSSTNINYIVKTGYSATAEYQVVQTAFNASTNPGTGPGATARQVFIEGTFTTTVAGTFAVRYASEVAASAVSVLPNSFCTIE